MFAACKQATRPASLLLLLLLHIYSRSEMLNNKQIITFSLLSALYAALPHGHHSYTCIHHQLALHSSHAPANKASNNYDDIFNDNVNYTAGSSCMNYYLHLHRTRFLHVSSHHQKVPITITHSINDDNHNNDKDKAVQCSMFIL